MDTSYDLAPTTASDLAPHDPGFDFLLSRSMTIRLRKFVGTLATVTYLIAYALVAMAVGGQYVVGQNVAVELVFYIFAGIAWLPGAMVIIKWMSKP
jgi:Protein of unknown function (DUF2842)